MTNHITTRSISELTCFINNELLDIERLTLAQEIIDEHVCEGELQIDKDIDQDILNRESVLEALENVLHIKAITVQRLRRELKDALINEKRAIRDLEREKKI